MKDRIKKLRKELDLTQQEFADRLSIKRGGIANYEIGRNEPADSVISLICREFNVNETWLRTGAGEMFAEVSEEDLFARAAASLSKDAFVRSLIAEYWKLEDENRRLFREFVCRLADGMRGAGAAGLPAPQEKTVAELESEYKKSRSDSARSTGLSASSTAGGAEMAKEA